MAGIGAVIGEAAATQGVNQVFDMIFGGGGGSQPPQYGFSQGSSFNVGGSSNQNQSSSISQQNPDFVWGVQSPYLADMYSKASSMLGAQGPYTERANQTMFGAQGALDTLMNPGANPLMEVYQRQMQQGLEQNILPTIRRQAASGNMLGSTRQGVAEGMATQEAAAQQSEFAANLYNQDMNRVLGAAGISGDVAQAGLGVPWYGLNQLAGILGPPTVLGGGGFSSSQASGSGSAYNLGGSEQYSIYGPDADNPYAPPGVIPVPPAEETPPAGGVPQEDHGFHGGGK